jgi:hypothetical protein
VTATPRTAPSKTAKLSKNERRAHATIGRAAQTTRARPTVAQRGASATALSKRSAKTSASGKRRATAKTSGPPASIDPGVWAKLNDPALGQVEGALAKTGDHAECVNGWGVFDMVGNLHEWVATDASLPNGTFAGGYYLDTSMNGDGCDYRTTAHSPVYYDYSTGFRCCADAGFEDESPTASTDSEMETLARRARGSEPTKVTFTEPTKIPGVRTAAVNAGPVETRSEG